MALSFALGGTGECCQHSCSLLAGQAGESSSDLPAAQNVARCPGDIDYFGPVIAFVLSEPQISQNQCH